MQNIQYIIIIISTVILVFGSIVIMKYFDYKEEVMIQSWKYNIEQEQNRLDEQSNTEYEY